MTSAVPRIRILLLDADSDRPHPITTALLDHGIDLVTGCSDDPAIEGFMRRSVDAVLLDAQSACSRTIDACARLRRLAGDDLLPVVILMDHDDEAFIVDAFAAGATDCFPRLLHARLLTQRLHRLVGAARLQCDMAVLRRQVDRDALTQLHDRRGFITAAQSAMDGAQGGIGMSSTLLLIDIDRFKRFNDSIGPAAGDEVLRACARRLRATFRRFPGSVVGRVASDEFAVLLPRLSDPAGMRCAAQQALAEISRPMSCATLEFVLTASVGIAQCAAGQSATPVGVDLMLAHAGIALSAAKASGGNAVRAFEPGIRRVPSVGPDLESRLHRAVERCELVLHYQPIIDPRSRRVAGMEALMRWQRDGRLVYPDGFIPLAEETGLIFQMGEWAIRAALEQLRAWRDAGLHVPRVAVNIHPGHLARAPLADAVEQAVVATGLAAGALEIELTETGVMRDVDRSIGSLHALRELGVRLALDDFGTGNSSLAYLTQLPIDTLKIDRSFVQRLDHDEQSHAVVRSITALAQALGLSTVAEGVETPEQLASLCAFGCDVVQGYVYARPMPGTELAQWWQRFALHAPAFAPVLQPT